MTYRPAKIRMDRCRWGWNAYLLLHDDGLDDDGMPQWAVGLGLEQGPYWRPTHRWAWRRAYQAAGRRLSDVPDSFTVSRELEVPRNPTKTSPY